MKIYFDESGQSGCLLLKKDLLNFKQQPTFAIGALILKTKKDEEKMINKYNKFKEKFNIIGEIKGNDLVTKEYNPELKYFIDNIIDDSHFTILIYDKKFYIAVLLLISLLGVDYQYNIPEHFYIQATLLSKQNDDFFVNYLKYVENITIDTFNEYLKYLLNFDYIGFDNNENAVLIISKKIIDNNLQEKCYKDFMTYGWYENDKIMNLINLNALSEIIYSIKSDKNILNKDIEYIHDNIDEFEDTFNDELTNYGINISFKNGKENVLLQIIDNLVSIFCHTYNKTILHFNNKQEWKESSEWDLRLISKLQKKLSVSNINYTIPLCDWALLLCVLTMFSYHYPKKYRNNLYFNYYYIYNLNLIENEIVNNEKTLYYVIETLKK